MGQICSSHCIHCDCNIFFVCFVVVILQAEQLKIKDIVLSVYKRAVRNCPWSITLWQGLLRSQEKYGEEHEKIKGKNVVSAF